MPTRKLDLSKIDEVDMKRIIGADMKHRFLLMDYERYIKSIMFVFDNDLYLYLAPDAASNILVTCFMEKSPNYINTFLATHKGYLEDLYHARPVKQCLVVAYWLMETNKGKRNRYQIELDQDQGVHKFIQYAAIGNSLRMYAMF